MRVLIKKEEHQVAETQIMVECVDAEVVAWLTANTKVIGVSVYAYI